MRDIDVPFWPIVVILIKWSIAAIPAFIVVMFVCALMAALVTPIVAMIGVSLPDIPVSPN